MKQSTTIKINKEANEMLIETSYKITGVSTGREVLELFGFSSDVWECSHINREDNGDRGFLYRRII